MFLPSHAMVSGNTVLFTSALFALSVVIKYIVERGRNQVAHLGPGSFNYYERVARSRKSKVAFCIYKYSFHARPLLSLLLLVMPGVAGISLAFSFLAEMYVLFRYHLVLMTALGFLISSLPIGLWGINIHMTMSYAAPGVPFIQVLLAAMYGFSAVRKWRNGFANGRVLEYGVEVSLDHRKYEDHICLSGTLLAFIARYCKWPTIAKVVIFGELIIGVLLLLPDKNINVVGTLIAVMAQTCFTLLFPRTLLPFTLTVFAALVISV